MSQTLGSSEQLLEQELRRSSLACPECGSFLDAPRMNPTTGNVARKCMACQVWHVLVPLRWEGSD